MDANEIDKLEGRALDAAVAEHVMGCKWVQISEHERGLVVGRDHKYLMVGVLVRDDDDRPTYVDNLPAYSLDWREAGRVVDYLMLDGWRVEMGIADEPWYVLLVKGKRQVSAYGYRGGTDNIGGAICRAALKAVMS